MIRYFFFLLFSCVAFAQTVLDLGKNGIHPDFSAMAVTRPVTVGATLPKSCLLGQLFFKTTATPGANLYGCTAANVWTVLGGVLATPPVSAPPVSTPPVSTPTTPTPPTPIPPVSTPSTGTVTPVANGIAWASPSAAALVAAAGQSITITADHTATWTLAPGSAGTLSTANGKIVYTAPKGLTAQNAMAGCLVSPNDSVFNTAIDTLPVDPQSDAWIAQSLGIGLAGFTLTPSWGHNLVTAAQPKTAMNFYYSWLRNGAQYPLLTGNNRNRETGSMATDGNNDHHMITLNWSTCHWYETYHDYLSGIEPSPYTANSGYDWTGTSYATATGADGGGSTDAAGLPLTPLIPHLSEVEAGVINHAFRFSSCAGCISQVARWPAISSTAAAANAAPMGSRWRLKASVNIAGFSPKAQIFLLALKKYGAYLADIGGMQQGQADSDILQDPSAASALNEINGARLSQANFEIVDTSSLMLDAKSTAAASKTTASAVLVGTDSTGKTVRVPIALQPVLVGTPHEWLIVQAGTDYQIPTWVSGSSNQAVAWTLVSGSGSVSSSGVYSAPASTATVSAFVLLGTAAADPAAQILVQGKVVPAGGIRIDVAGGSDYTDTLGNVWMADQLGWQSGGYSDQMDIGYPSDWLGSGIPAADARLWGTFKYTWGDDISYGPFIVPNGTYQVQFLISKVDCSGTYSESPVYNNGLQSGGAVGLDVNGTMVTFNLGATVHDTCHAPATPSVTVTVTDHVLTATLRALGGPQTHQAPILNGLAVLKQ